MIKNNYSIRIRFIIQQGKRCEKCGYDLVPEILEVHHQVPLSEGGADDLSNALVLCPNCHRIAHRNGLTLEQMLDKIRQGYHVKNLRQRSTPEKKARINAYNRAYKKAHKKLEEA